MQSIVTVYSNETELSREVWRFWYGSRGFVLDGWRRETRATKRHKWTASSFDGSAWGRLTKRDNRIERPEPPASVIAAARSVFAASLTYVGQTDA